MQHRKAVQTENYPRASKAPKRIDIRYSILDSHSITKKPLGDVITSDHTRRELMRNCAQPTKRENECHNTIDKIDSAVSANGLESDHAPVSVQHLSNISNIVLQAQTQTTTVPCYGRR